MRPVRINRKPETTRSPESGWTRDHWEEMFADLIVPVIDNGSPGKARQIIPGPRSHHGRLADELEGFTRSFIMAAPWLATASSPVVRSADGPRDVAGFYAEGILNGTNPKHPEYWGDIVDYAQHLVEMASLAWGLFASRSTIWDGFSAADKKQVAGYLYQCTAVAYHQNNWLLFNVVTNAVLKRLGMPFRQDQIDANIDACEHMYIGSGWYRDGSINRIDYYNAWGFHYYYLIWAILDGESKPDIAARHRERIRELAAQLPYFVSGDGSAPVFGRSMIYRFAYLGPVVLAAFMGELDDSMGLMRSVCNRTMQFFADQPIVTDQGFLGLGFVGPNESMLEHYSCGGSPYWASKAFNAFLMPPDHPFWTATEKPLPISRGDYVYPIEDAGIVLVGSHGDGQVQIVNQKSYHDKVEYNPKYTNFAYSSLFPYESRGIYQSWAPDTAIQFSADGILFNQRWEMETIAVSPRHAAARYALGAADPDGDATTTILFHRGTLTLIHEVRPTRQLWVREGGFALGFDIGAPAISGFGSEAESADWTAVSAAGRISFIASLYGYDRIEPGVPYGLDVQGTNVRYRSSVIPTVSVRRTDTEPFLLVSLVAGRGDAADPANLRAVVAGIAVDGDTVVVVYGDGTQVSVRARSGEVRF